MAKSAAGSAKTGSLQVAADVAAGPTAADLTAAGHTFGILGQNVLASTTRLLSTTASAFIWNTSDTAQHTMAVNIFPYSDAAASITKITIQGSVVKWAAAWAMPTWVAATALTAVSAGASTIAASTAAVVAVVATLY